MKADTLRFVIENGVVSGLATLLLAYLCQLTVGEGIVVLCAFLLGGEMRSRLTEIFHATKR